MAFEVHTNHGVVKVHATSKKHARLRARIRLRMTGLNPPRLVESNYWFAKAVQE